MPISRNFFQRVPFIRITCHFLIGIMLNHYLSFDLRLIGILFTILLSALLLLWHNTHFSAVRIQNLVIAAGLILAGIFYPNQSREKHLPDFTRRDYYLAELCQKPAEKLRTYQSVLLIRNHALIKPEKVVVYFSKEKFDTTLTTGDQLVLLAKPQQIKNMGNPFEFDYQTMMHSRGIWFSIYLAKGTYLKTGVRLNKLIYSAEQIRDELITLLAKVIKEKEERSVVSALTLGYRAEIGQDTIDYFASTGAMHVLSVSGLHVALIFMILGFLLSFLRRGKTGLLTFSITMILFLWFYAFISGFSPSVQRATVMFTFVIIGNGISRPINIYNSLTASALFLILLNPNVIFDIGFQLSYLAVFGIVLIQPILYNLIEVNHKFLHWIWTLTTVSVAAQLTTFPLGLFYFNQFPNLFWLSNFIVIPVTTIIIWLTLAFFVLSPFHAISGMVAQLIEWSTSFMLWILKEMSELPYAVCEGIVISPLQTFILYCILTTFLVYIFSKGRPWLFCCLMFIVFFQTDLLKSKLSLLNQRGLYVYNSKNTLIHLINGRTNYLVTNGLDTISLNERNMVRRVQNHLKLSNPILINKRLNRNLLTTEVIINDHEIQFLNCQIKIGDQHDFHFQGSDVVKLIVINKNPSKRGGINTDRAVGNSHLDEKQTFIVDRKSRRNGAYFLRLD